MKSVLRVALLGGCIAAASAAHALVIDFIWTGSYMPATPAAGSDAVLADSLVGGNTVFDLVPGSVPITGVAYSYTVGAAATVGSGFLFIGTPANLAGVGAVFSFNFTGNNTSDGVNGTLMTLNGVGAGPYAGYTTTTGQLSHTDHAYPGPFTAGGQFSSVPEPASIAAIGLGLVGLVRRRVVNTR